MAVSYEEAHGWPKAVWVPEGFNGVRQLFCAWEDRDTLAQELLGGDREAWPYGVLAETDANTGEIIADPSSIPRVVRVKVEPFPAQILPEAGSGQQRATYEKALLTVTYATGIYTLVGVDGGNVLLRETLEPAGQFDTLNNTVFYRPDGAGGFEPFRQIEAPGKMITRLAYTLTYHNIVGEGEPWAIFVGKCMKFMNYCNTRRWDTYTKAFSFPSQSLQYMYTTFDRSLGFNADQTWTIKQRFLAQYSFGKAGVLHWNRTWDPKSETFIPYYDAAGNVKQIVPDTDFRQLKIVLPLI